MRKRLVLLLLFVISITGFTTSSCSTNATSIDQIQDSVYICFSSTAHVYHSSRNCSGLSHCTHEIIKVSLSDAINKYGRRACKICE